MRITKESLLRIARETVSQRIHARPELVAAYLTGSVLGDEPLLGNTTDIDLVFVHPIQPFVRREIVPLSAEVHLDIKYNPRSEYKNPRELRCHPWLGPEMYSPLRLYDGRHFFDFVQAGVREKFYEPANSYRRGLLNAQHARQIWADVQHKKADRPETVLAYLKSINHAANAIAVIKGSPLSERRFLLQFQTCAASAGNESLAEALYELLGGQNTDKDSLAACLPAWEQDFLKAGENPEADIRLHRGRLGYYRQGFEALLGSEKPRSILWAFLHTWSLAANSLPEADIPAWTACCRELGLIEAGFKSQLEKLDTFLDEVESILDNMATLNGINDIEDI
jgi:hypothetical protein